MKQKSEKYLVGSKKGNFNSRSNVLSFLCSNTWCFYIEHDLQSNHALEHTHASPCKATPLLSESAEPSAKKYKFRPAEETEEHFVLSVLMGDGNFNLAKIVQALQETLTSLSWK